jgi:hypothetical protein
MEKKMLYVSFFTACAGLITCMYNVFNGDMSWMNLILFVMFCIIAMTTAIMERDMLIEESKKKESLKKQIGDNTYTERV